MNRFPLVMVEWADSFGVGPSWQPIDLDRDYEPFNCFSVGWLVHDGDRVKVLVPHIHDDCEDIGATLSGCGDMAIPAVAVVKMTYLKAAKI